MLPALFSLLLLAQTGAEEDWRPVERSVKIVDVANSAKNIRVRLLPVRVYKVQTRGGVVDGMTAKWLDSASSTDRRVIVAADLFGDDREWFESETLKLWKRYPTVDFLLGEQVRKQIQEKQR